MRRRDDRTRTRALSLSPPPAVAECAAAACVSSGNVFDGDLNKFFTIRRPADIWQWGNAVLWPGLLGNLGPECSQQQDEGDRFQSADMAGTTNLTRPGSSFCNNDLLPDGEGYLGTGGGGTPPTVAEVVDRMNQFDWTDGLRILQVRAAPTSAESCGTATIGGKCSPELGWDGYRDATAPFGYNWTHKGNAPLSYPFRWHSAVEMGSAPVISSSAPSSHREFSGDGYASFVIPFFSDEYLPDERGKPCVSGGTASGPCDVRDFTPHRIMRTKALSRVPRYFCVRLSWDAEHVHQLCDPNDPMNNNRTTGIVRGATVEFWNDMRRAQYVDPATRMLEVRIPLASNPTGVRSTARLMFEFTSTGGVLPSYDTMTRVAKDSSLDALEYYVLIGLAFSIYFGALEVIEIISIGIGRYAAAAPHRLTPPPLLSPDPCFKGLLCRCLSHPPPRAIVYPQLPLGYVELYGLGGVQPLRLSLPPIEDLHRARAQPRLRRDLHHHWLHRRPRAGGRCTLAEVSPRAVRLRAAA